LGCALGPVEAGASWVCVEPRQLPGGAFAACGLCTVELLYRLCVYVHVYVYVCVYVHVYVYVCVYVHVYVCDVRV